MTYHLVRFRNLPTLPAMPPNTSPMPRVPSGGRAKARQDLGTRSRAHLRQPLGRVGGRVVEQRQHELDEISCAFGLPSSFGSSRMALSSFRRCAGVASSRLKSSSCAFTSAIASRWSPQARGCRRSRWYRSPGTASTASTPPPPRIAAPRRSRIPDARDSPLNVFRNVLYSPWRRRRRCESRAPGRSRPWPWRRLARSIIASNSSGDSSFPRSSNVNGKNANPSVIRIHTSLAFREPAPSARGGHGRRIP